MARLNLCADGKRQGLVLERGTGMLGWNWKVLYQPGSKGQWLLKLYVAPLAERD